jgi:hypothetical protein
MLTHFRKRRYVTLPLDELESGFPMGVHLSRGECRQSKLPGRFIEGQDAFGIGQPAV